MNIVEGIFKEIKKHPRIAITLCLIAVSFLSYGDILPTVFARDDEPDPKNITSGVLLGLDHSYGIYHNDGYGSSEPEVLTVGGSQFDSGFRVYLAQNSSGTTNFIGVGMEGRFVFQQKWDDSKTWRYHSDLKDRDYGLTLDHKGGFESKDCLVGQLRTNNVSEVEIKCGGEVLKFATNNIPVSGGVLQESLIRHNIDANDRSGHLYAAVFDNTHPAVGDLSIPPDPQRSFIDARNSTRSPKTNVYQIIGPGNIEALKIMISDSSPNALVNVVSKKSRSVTTPKELGQDTPYNLGMGIPEQLWSLVPGMIASIMQEELISQRNFNPEIFNYELWLKLDSIMRAQQE